MIHRVEMTTRASKDLEEVASYVLARARRQGEVWLDGLEEAIAALDQFPAAHPRAPESPSARGEEIRQLFYGARPHTYRILFTVNDAAHMVFVLTIRRCRRLPVTGL